MIQQKDWQEFLESLCSSAWEEYTHTDGYRFLQEKQEQLDARLDSGCVDDPQTFLADYIFEVKLDAERQASFLYRKGLQDGVILLKQLGVLS